MRHILNLSALWPDLSELRAYGRSALSRDARAGFTVAVFAAPQAVAYALLAGLPPVHGLYAALVMSIVAALWGSSRYVNTGPTNSAALLTAAALAPWAGSPQFLGICFTLTLLVGALRLALGLLRMGRLVQFVPESGFLGFTVGAGLLIALGQLHHLLNVVPGPGTWAPGRVAGTLYHLGELNVHTTGIGLACLLLLLLTDRTRWRNWAPLTAIVLASLYALVLGPASGIRLVRDIVPVGHGLPAFVMPSWSPDTVIALLPSALAISLVGLIEAVSIGLTLALKHRERLDFDREFVGQGMSHLVSAFFQGMPGSGSFSRSALMEHLGAATRLANVYFGLFTAAALLVAPRLLDAIPVSALAGLLLFIGYKLVNVPRILRVVATSRPDVVLLVATFLVTVFVRIEYGIFIGVVLGALLYLQRACGVHLAELVPNGGDRFDELPYEPGVVHAPSALVALTLSGDLFYGQAPGLRDQLEEILRLQQPRHLVIRMRRAYSVDFSCWSALLDCAEALVASGGRLYLTGVRPDLQKVVGREALCRLIPPDRVYAQTEEPFEAFSACLADVLKAMPGDQDLPPAWQQARRVVGERA